MPLFLLKLYLRFSLAGTSLSRAGTDEDRAVLGRLGERIFGPH